MSFNKSILVLVILLVSCSPKKQEPAVTWLYGYGQVEKLNGKVKKLTEKKFINNHIQFCFVYIFNNKGDLIQIVTEDFSPNSIDTAQYNTVYNGDKKKEAIGMYFDIGKKIREIYKYDNNGYITKYIHNANDLPTDTDRLFYDNAANLVEHQQYFQKKPLWIFKFQYLYNKSAVCTGVKQSMTTWRDSFKRSTKDTTRYIAFDSKKNWIKAVDFLKDTTTRKITYY